MWYYLLQTVATFVLGPEGLKMAASHLFMDVDHLVSMGKPSSPDVILRSPATGGTTKNLMVTLSPAES